MVSLLAYFRRGRHRPNAHRETVNELTQQLNAELALKHPTSFHLSADGKYLAWQATLNVASWEGCNTEGFITIAPPGEVVAIDVDTYDDERSRGLLSKLEGGPW